MENKMKIWEVHDHDDILFRYNTKKAAEDKIEELKTITLEQKKQAEKCDNCCLGCGLNEPCSNFEPDPAKECKNWFYIDDTSNYYIKEAEVIIL